jgi:hypothetical protein
VDAKTDLLSRLLNNSLSGSVFLDCLNPALGCVNRLFVFGSVVHSRAAYIIRTPNFSDSPWCLKEQRLAEYLSKRCEVDCYIFTTIDEAWDHLVTNKSVHVSDADTVSHRSSIEDLSSGPLWYIYPDFNKEDRSPNRKTLSEYPGFLEAVDRIVSGLVEGDWRGKLRSGSLVAMVAEAVQKFFDEVGSLNLGEVENHEASGSFSKLPIDALIVIGQIIFGALSVGTKTANKIESRQAADSFIRMVTEFVTLAAELKDLCTEQSCAYFLAMTIAKALQFDREQSNPLPVEVGRRLCSDVVTFKERQVLFDVRGGSKVAEFRLRLASMLIRYGIGTVGIVQSALNTVHDKSIDGFDLSVLPCITIYPGMAGMLGLKE